MEAFGITAARNYIGSSLIRYFVACGVQVEGLSSNACQRAQVDNPQQSLDNPRRRHDEQSVLHGVLVQLRHLAPDMTHAPNLFTVYLAGADAALTLRSFS